MAEQSLNAQIVIGTRGIDKALSEFQALNKAVGALGARAKSLGAGLATLGAGYIGLDFFKKSLQSAADFQGEMAHVATAVDDGAKTAAHLAEVQKFANDTARSSVVTNAEVAEGYYIARSAMLSHVEALGAAAAGNRLVTATMRDAADGQQSFEPATRLLADTFKLFGDRTRAVVPQLDGFADTLANLQTQFSFKSIGEVIYGLQYAEPAAKAAGVAFNDAAAALAMLSAQGLHGAEAGTAAEELFSKLATGGKLAGLAVRNSMGGLDVGATMHRLNDMYGKLPAMIQERALTQLGFGERDIRGVTLLMSKWKELGNVHATLDHSAGVAAAKAAERLHAEDAQLAILANQWALLKESLGEGLLGPLATVVSYLRPILTSLANVARAHSTITAIGLGFVAVAASISAMSGVLSILGIARLATVAWTGAQWALNAAMAANPIGLAVAAAVTLAAAGYEIYENWSAIAAAIERVAAAISALGKAMFTAGAHLMGELARGMGSAAMAPVHAVEAMAHRIRAYLPFSPAKVGPLRDLHRTRIVQTVAETMQPGPVIAQMRRVAAAAALAVPMMVSPAFASLRPGTAGPVSAGITINSSPRITISTRDGATADIEKAVVAALDKHAYELTQILRREGAKQSRLQM